MLVATVLPLYPPISQRQSELLSLLFTFSGLAKVCWGASLLFSFNMHQQDRAIWFFFFGYMSKKKLLSVGDACLLAWSIFSFIYSSPRVSTEVVATIVWCLGSVRAADKIIKLFILARFIKGFLPLFRHLGTGVGLSFGILTCCLALWCSDCPKSQIYSTWLIL